MQHALDIASPDSQFLCALVYLFCDLLWPEVRSRMHVTASCSARVLDQARPTMSCIHLVL